MRRFEIILLKKIKIFLWMLSLEAINTTDIMQRPHIYPSPSGVLCVLPFANDIFLAIVPSLRDFET